MFDKRKLMRGLRAPNYEDTFIFLLHCGASLHQIVPSSLDHITNKISTFDYIVTNFLWSPIRSINLILKIFANVKINFNASSMEKFRNQCFRSMEYEYYKGSYSGPHMKEVLKVALLNGLVMPEFSRKYRKKWCRDFRYILQWNTFMLLYCFELKNVNAFLF